MMSEEEGLTLPPEFLLGEESRGDLSLVELVNRVLDRGAVVSGDIVISVGGVDLVYVGLRVLLASVESMIARENSPDRDRN